MQHDEIAILFEKVIHCENYLEFVPVAVIEGKYNEESKLFISKVGTPYPNIINSNTTHGYFQREKISEYKKKYPLLPTPLIKSLLLHYAKKLIFVSAKEKNTNSPIILMSKKNSNSTPKLVLDNDILAFYREYYPNMLNMISNELGNEENNTEEQKQEEKKVLPNPTEEININDIYKELTEHIINQDEPIKQILTAIWKQYNGFSEQKARNILINGSTGVGKTEIFRIITKKLQIPHFITSATEYSATGYIGKSTEDMLLNLLRNANYDLEKAQKGILIIDEIDKLAESNGKTSQINQKDVQESLLKILKDAIVPIVTKDKEYMFDTSKLMVIGLGSFSRIKLENKTPLGFERQQVKKEYKDITRDDMVKNGMIEELIGRFPIVIQMNELEEKHLLLILKTKNSILNINKEFFNKKNIELIIDENTLKEIAAKASKQKYGARSLDEIIETALSVASFEIAQNPDLYSKLIITEDTIKDKKNYTLIKKEANK